MGSPRLGSRVVLAAGFALCYSAAVAQNSPAGQAHASRGNSRIVGVVVSSTSAHPLARARVSLIDTRNPQDIISLITSGDGGFEFNQVSAGKYALRGAKRGFITAAYNQHGQFSTAIVAGAGLDTSHLTLRLDPSAALAGHIFDESGDPVRKASVTVYREDNFSGVSRVRRWRNATTDDQGSFEVEPLDAGTYFVSVKAAPWYAVHPVSSHPEGTAALPSLVDRSFDVAYPITYYGDATDPEAATAIPIRGGDHLEVDIHLNPVPALHLILHVSQEAQNQRQMPVLQQQAFDGTAQVERIETQTVSPGTIEITGVAAGRYTVRMQGSAAAQEWNEVELTSDGQELEASSSQPTGSVKASVQVRGEAKLPPELGIGLRNSKRRVIAWQDVDAHGEVQFQNVSPGPYEVLAGSVEKSYSVVRIASPGGQVAGHVLNVTGGSSLAVSLSLVGGAADVEGFAKRAGKGVPGAMIVLVPKNPAANRDRFRRDQSDSDGSFRLRDVIPGSYTVVAIENGWDLDWGQPGVISHYAKRGQAVAVGSKAGGAVRLREVVEVQPR